MTDNFLPPVGLRPDQNLQYAKNLVRIENLKGDTYLFSSSEEQKTARNSLLSISFLGVLYSGYTIEIASLFGTKIIDAQGNISTVLFLLIVIQLLTFLLLYYRDLYDKKIERTEYKLNRIKDIEKNIKDKFSISKEDADLFKEKDLNLKKENLQKFNKYMFYILIDGLFPLILSFIALIFLWKESHPFYLLQKLWEIMGCWIALFVIIPIIIFFFIQYFLKKF